MIWKSLLHYLAFEGHRQFLVARRLLIKTVELLCHFLIRLLLTRLNFWLVDILHSWFNLVLKTAADAKGSHLELLVAHAFCSLVFLRYFRPMEGQFIEFWAYCLFLYLASEAFQSPIEVNLLYCSFVHILRGCMLLTPLPTLVHVLHLTSDRHAFMQGGRMLIGSLDWWKHCVERSFI